MTNSEQVAFNAMLRDCKNALFVPEQSVYKMIDVVLFDTVVEVTVELFNHDEEPTFSIESAFFKDVDILHVIECLGGLSELTAVVEKKLKEENCDD